MTTRLVNDIAGFIRRIDGNNRLPARVLGGRIADFVNGLDGLSRDIADLRTQFADFVERTNPDKQMGAGALAELIVAEFDLDGADR